MLSTRGYVPSSSIAPPILGASLIIALTEENVQSMNGKPVVTHYLTTPFGRLAIISLPVTQADVISNRELVKREALAGVKLAADLGAKQVSFTGMVRQNLETET